jgi:glycogen debranching enzyme
MEVISPFRTPATVLVENQGRRVLKNGNSFAVLDAFGNAQAAGPAAEGLFFEDTRHLSRLVTSIDGIRPLLLSSAVTADNAMLLVDLTNPDLIDKGELRQATSTLHLLSTIVLDEDALFTTVEVRNFGATPTRFEIALDFEADFADIFEVRGSRRPQHGTVLPARQGPEGTVLGYRGLDGVVRRTRVVFDPPPDTTTPSRATWRTHLPPGERFALHSEMHCERDEHPASTASRAANLLVPERRHVERGTQTAQVCTDNTAFDEWLRSSRADLDMLMTETPQGLYAYAGIPWFSTAFGRDGLITALECLWIDPRLAAGTLSFLAANQATAADPATDAEPGKILHETRKGEMAALGEVPFGRYYGSIDATPLFVMLAGQYYARTGDLALVQALWPNIEAALTWMTVYGDRDGDGFIEYDRRSPNGLVNQGWKDSGDAVFHADGGLAEAPIALAEVQAYAYAAYLGAAELARALDQHHRAEELAVAAGHLKERFEAAFWLEDLGTYALALDGTKRPCRVRSSNAGQVLATGLASPERAARVAETLMAPGSFSGWGIRTIAEGEARYNPMSYHNGSVWPHDNALIALGFAHYGLTEPMLRVLSGLFDASGYLELKRLPELLCGFARRPAAGPTGYPVACAPQAWAAASVFAILGAALGISFAPHERQIHFTRPILPAWLGEVRLANLKLGEASVDLLVRRGGKDVAVSVVRRDGPVEIVLTS